MSIWGRFCEHFGTISPPMLTRRSEWEQRGTKGRALKRNDAKGESHLGKIGARGREKDAPGSTPPLSARVAKSQARGSWDPGYVGI